jgi:RNA polymerase sigma factor (sigma-70 family)
VSRLDPSLVRRLHVQSHAARWQVTQESFAATLDASVAHAFPQAWPGEAAAERYVSGLHLEDLALAAACACGSEAAWQQFVTQYRPALQRAADAIDPTGGARELADALFGELFGLVERDGARQSLFRYFHGRSRLGTWLRAVLSQRFVDRRRADRRLEPITDVDVAADATGSRAPGATDRPRFEAAMRDALASAIADLPPRDRLRLSCYYAQQMSLAEIGRLLGEHEATASRHLARVRKTIRAAVETRLREQHGFDEPALAECFASVANDAGALDLGDLIGAVPDRKNAGRPRSNE